MSWMIAEWADARLEVPQRTFGAIIFDCDGTLVDSMPIHYLCWVDSLRHHHAPFEFTEEVFYSLAGIREQDAVKILNERHGAEVDPEGVAEFKLERFKKRFREIEPVRPVAALAEAAHGRGVPIAVASGSEEVTVRGCLEATGLLPLFEVLITPRLVRRGKPAPDMFLLAAERLGVAPESCLVVEDGQSGLDAAKAAGMSAVYVPRHVR